MTTPMQYTEYHPALELKPWIAAHWHFYVDPSVAELDHWVPPNGGAMITIIEDGPVILSGPRVEPLSVKVRGGTHIWGSMFWPGTATSLSGVDIESIANNSIPAQFAFSQSADSPARSAWLKELGSLSALLESPEQMLAGLDHAFGKLVADALPLDHKVMHSVFQILQADGAIEVSQVAKKTGLSPRQLRRRFRSATGLAPKELVRIERLRRSAVDAVIRNDLSWISLAAERGYSDQAHLVREFQNLMGISPGSFKKHFREIDHRNLIR